MNEQCCPNCGASTYDELYNCNMCHNPRIDLIEAMEKYTDMTEEYESLKRDMR